MPEHVSRHYLEKRLAFAGAIWPRGSHLLDVGCGTGRLGAGLARGGFRVTGIDRSIGMLHHAGTRGIAAVCASADALPWADDVFDGAISVAVLHHLAAPALVAASIAEMIRVTRPGGRVVIWDHNPLNPYWPIFMRGLPQDDGSERLIGRREVRRAIAGGGGRVVSEAGLGWVPGFMPAPLMGLNRTIERLLERTPGAGWLAAHNVFVVRK